MLPNMNPKKSLWVKTVSYQENFTIFVTMVGETTISVATLLGVVTFQKETCVYEGNQGLASCPRTSRHTGCRDGDRPVVSPEPQLH